MLQEPTKEFTAPPFCIMLTEVVRTITVKYKERQFRGIQNDYTGIFLKGL